MAATAINTTNERRSGNKDLDSFWHLLSFAQKVALNKLNQYGYQLSFARALESDYLAFAKCNNTYATIDYNGEVELNPQEVIR